ncbi:MAG: type II secretion system F family protein [Caulobacteraceae bacterium]
MTVRFQYRARDRNGRAVKGALEAGSPPEALARLRQRDLTPLALEREASGAVRRHDGAAFDEIAARDLTRTLAQLLRSGLGLPAALQFACDELTGASAGVAQRIRESLDRGERPSAALSDVNGAPARLLSGVLVAGEASGRLAEALEVAAASFTQSAALKARVVASMIYPAFVLLATLATLSAFIFFVVPTLAGAFEGSEAKLPETTKFLLGVSAWLKANALIALLIALIAGLLIWSSRAAKAWLAAALEFVLASPAGLGIAPRLQFAGFAELAALSLLAGVPVAQAFEAARSGVTGPALSRQLEAFVSAVRLGERPSEAMRRLARPPRALGRLMQVGEETGDLGTAMRQASVLLNDEAEQRLTRLGAIAGPMITLGLGGLVASVVLSLFLGLLAMSDMAAAG